MLTFKELREKRMAVSADYKISASGRKVHKMKKIADTEDDLEDKDDDKEVKEGAVPDHMRGKQKPYVSSDGKGNFEVLGNKGQTKAEFSRKEHGSMAQGKARAHLKAKYDEYMKEETIDELNLHYNADDANNKVNANKMKAHLAKRGISASHQGGSQHRAILKVDTNNASDTAYVKNKVKGRYDVDVREETELEEAVDKQEQRFLQLARLGLVDKASVSKLRIAIDQLKADKVLTAQQRSLLLNVMMDLVNLVTGDDAVFQRVKMDVQKESTEDLDENTAALQKKASASGVSLGVLKTVYRRGVAAWNSGHRPGTTPQQWGMARVNSYITKGKGTYGGADKDLHEDGEPTEFDVNDIDEACWDTHKQVGMKKKNGKMVPNCVPKGMSEDSRADNTAYHKGVSDKTAQARVSHWKKMDKLSDDNPKAYEPAPGDATAKTKTSKHTKKYHSMFGEGYVSLAQQRAVWASRKDGGKGHPDNKNKSTKKEESEVPFDGPYTKTPATTTDKSGAVHTPQSRVRHLARLALKKQLDKAKSKG